MSLSDVTAAVGDGSGSVPLEPGVRTVKLIRTVNTNIDTPLSLLVKFKYI